MRLLILKGSQLVKSKNQKSDQPCVVFFGLRFPRPPLLFVHVTFQRRKQMRGHFCLLLLPWVDGEGQTTTTLVAGSLSHTHTHTRDALSKRIAVRRPRRDANFKIGNGVVGDLLLLLICSTVSRRKEGGKKKHRIWLTLRGAAFLAGPSPICRRGKFSESPLCACLLSQPLPSLITS